MELLYDYLSNTIVQSYFMAMDREKELFAINIESYELTPTKIYGNEIYHGKIVMKQWVAGEVAKRNSNWKKSLKILLQENALGDPTVYKVLGYDETLFKDEVHFNFSAKKQEN